MTKIQKNKCIIIFSAILFCGIFGLAEVSEAKNLYVNNSGSPACSDSTTYANNNASNPWCTLLRATWGNTNRLGSSTPLQAAQAGDTVLITPGTYDDQSGWNTGSVPLYQPANSGSAGNRITFKGNGGLVRLTNGPPVTSNDLQGGPIIGGSGVAYITWDGFSISQSEIRYRYGQGVAVAYATPYIEFLNNVITGTNPILPEGRLGDQHNGILFIGGGGDASCSLGDTNGLTIRNNHITGFNRTIGPSGNSSSITIYCEGDDILIENNELSYSSGGGIYAKGAYDSSTNIIIRNNYMHHNLYGMLIQGHSNWRTYKNLFVSNSVAGYVFFNTQYYVGFPTVHHPEDFYVVNNTFHNNGAAFYFKSYCSHMRNNHVKNNIVTGSTDLIYVDSEECKASTNFVQEYISHNYNIYNWTNKFMNPDGGSEWINFSTWVNTWGQDANTVIATDPLYINSASGNYRLQGSSPAIGAGVDILDLDVDGQTNDAITLGAYINGNECIGLESGCGGGDTTAPSAPSGLSVQ